MSVCGSCPKNLARHIHGWAGCHCLGVTMMDGTSLYLKSNRSNPWNDDFDTGCGSDEMILSNASAERADVQRAVVIRMGMSGCMFFSMYCGFLIENGSDFLVM